MKPTFLRGFKLSFKRIKIVEDKPALCQLTPNNFLARKNTNISVIFALFGRRENMQENKDPAIKLFGKRILLQEDGEIPAVSGGDMISHLLGKEVDEEEEEEREVDKGSQPKKSSNESTPKNEHSSSRDTPPERENSRDLETTSNSNVNPKTPSRDEESAKSILHKDENEANNYSQESYLKKPDKILPCPRCNSMDTKFCYYNNYNVSQPRHFCKACQRYWTAGGNMRNVPVGAGRRKNKNSAASQYQQFTISEALQAATIDPPNGRVLSFSVDAPICDSMASVVNFADKVMSSNRNGYDCKIKGGAGENCDDCGSSSSVTVSNSMDEVGRKCSQEAHITYLPGVPWHYPWNTSVPPPSFCPPGFPMMFYPEAYWNCSVQGNWNIPTWLSPQLSSLSQKSPNSSSNSQILGKHSRDGDMLISENSEKEQQKKNKSGCVLVPKTLRVDNPNEASKSSIWETLGMKNDSLNGDRLFKGFQSKNDEKANKITQNSSILRANPAALARALNFQESY